MVDAQAMIPREAWEEYAEGTRRYWELREAGRVEEASRWCWEDEERMRERWGDEVIDEIAEEEDLRAFREARGGKGA